MYKQNNWILIKDPFVLFGLKVYAKLSTLVKLSVRVLDRDTGSNSSNLAFFHSFLEQVLGTAHCAISDLYANKMTQL